MPAFLERYPQICVHLKQVSNAADLSPHLRELSLDLAIGRVPKLIDDDIDAQILFYEQIFVVAGLDNPWRVSDDSPI